MNKKFFFYKGYQYYIGLLYCVKGVCDNINKYCIISE